MTAERSAVPWREPQLLPGEGQGEREEQGEAGGQGGAW